MLKKTWAALIFLCLIALLTTASDAFAGRELYVATNGTDTGQGDKDHPWRTITYAVGKLQPDDTLNIREGTYSEAVDLKFSGEPGKPIDIKGIGNVVIDGESQSDYNPAFDTKGKHYIRFNNLTVKNSRAGIHINKSTHIGISALRVQNSHFAVLMTDAAFVQVKNSWASDNRNAFRGEGKTHDILFDTVEAYNSKDIYDGYDLNYLNGDGFIFEEDTYNLMFRNIITGNHWDAGLDIKGDNVTIDFIRSFGNKNGLKLWGDSIRVSNALIYENVAQLKPSGGKVDGMGVNVRKGYTRISYSTFINNEAEDVKVADNGSLFVEKSIVFRNRPGGKLLGPYGSFDSHHVVWFSTLGGRSKAIPEGTCNLWENPLVLEWRENSYLLEESSPAYRFDPPLGAHL